MCGRTACSLTPDDICQRCMYINKQGQQSQPSWKEAPNNNTFWPGYNIPPTSYTPVMLSGRHFKDCKTEDCSERLIQPMHWGLIPSWHKGNDKNMQYNMSNARSDGLLEKASFRNPLKNGNRCVIIAEGFYEWHRKEKTKQPYYIYFSKESKDAVKEVAGGTSDTSTRLLTMAGLFDVWTPNDESEGPVYSYSVITVDADTSMSWMHDRMPAILDGEDEIRQWLDVDDVPLDKAMCLLRPKSCLSWHPVTTDVGNSRNKSADLVKPIKLKDAKSSASSKMMMSWLGKHKQTSKDTDNAEPVKKEKI